MEQTIKFFKLNNGENVVAYCLHVHEDSFKIRRPLSFTVENDVMSGRQMLNVKEWLPPIVCSTDEILLPKTYVIFATDVKDTFKEEFAHASEYLYSVEAKPKRGRQGREETKMVLKDPSTKPN